MSPILSRADTYEALQLESQLILIAHGWRPGPEYIVYFEKPVTGRAWEELRLMCIPGAPPLAKARTPSMTPFKIFSSVEAPEHLDFIVVTDAGGRRRVPVSHEPVRASGRELELPVLGSASTLEDAVKAMRNRNKRAVIVNYGPFDHELFMNYDVANAWGDETSFVGLRGRGTKINMRSAETRSVPRTHLYTLYQPVFDTASVTTLFEDVAAAVVSAAPVCLCSSNKKSHTVSQPPGSDNAPCVRPPSNHGIYRCF
jgi:hypothetical protein